MADERPHDSNNEDSLVGGEGTAASSLDHALLESLFYNEMMHLHDSDSILSNQLLNSLMADGSIKPQSEIDPKIAAEKDLFRDFGVNEYGNSLEDGAGETDDRKVAATATKQAPMAPSSLVAPAAAAGMSQFSAAAAPPVPRRVQLTSPDRKVSSLTASVAPDLLHGPKAIPRVKEKTPPHSTAAVTAASPGASATEEEKRSKLVNQFATLASRLGITLPSAVLQSLSQVANSQQAQLQRYVASNTVPPPVPPFQVPPVVQQLAATAEAAIASVSRPKRTRSESPPLAVAATSSSSAAAAVAAAAATVEANNKKRRKKPRLVECEHKLSELQAENAMLKRHLANLSAQSHQLDQERHAQESRMRQMLDEGSSEEALDEAVRTFQDMYSDYGRRRHKELVFHLDQLLRLANPTNFTKMGLWTMQSKNAKNPIASILQKELEINTQQGKKILDQREKIRTVCSNMKEVSDLPWLIVRCLGRSGDCVLHVSNS